MSYEEKVKSIIAEQSGVRLEKVTPITSLVYDLEMDDLDRVEICMDLEEEFGIDIPDEDFEKITNIQGVIDYIKTRTKEEK